MTASSEEYLKTIYTLLHHKSIARITDIADTLCYSKASVNKAVNNLKKEGLINYETYGNIELTEIGEKTAKDILKKHNTLKAFLTDVLNVDKDIAEIEARSMKHAVSEDTINKLELYIGSIIDVSKLTCDYNPSSEKCKRCSTAKTKTTFDLKLKKINKIK